MGARFRWLTPVGAAAAVLLAAAGGGPAAAQDDCPVESGPSGVVQQVIDGTTIGLGDGAQVRLLNVLAAASLGPGNSIESDIGEAVRALRALLDGQTVQLAFTGRRQDRHGRWLAHLYLTQGEKRVWVQAHLVERGLAVTHSLGPAGACVRALQAIEDRARTQRLGLWQAPGSVLARSWQTKTLLARMNAFQIVEGRVTASAATRNWTFINFGTDWRQDFTAAVAARDRRRFEGSDIDLSALQGARVRVRGWIESWNGPVIKITHPEQIEVLEAGSASTPLAVRDQADTQ